ncbi:MAG: hypothetical protein Q9226_006155 [Calogaya cf. arnoldii]
MLGLRKSKSNETFQTQQENLIHAIYDGLRLYLAMDSAEELKDWMNKEDGLYEPGWDELCKNYLNKAQEAAKAAGEMRFRHHDLAEVRGHLYGGGWTTTTRAPITLNNPHLIQPRRLPLPANARSLQIILLLEIDYAGSGIRKKMEK